MPPGRCRSLRLYAPRPTGDNPIHRLWQAHLDQTGVRAGRARLTFQGRAVHEADLVAAPGLSHSVARQLWEAIGADQRAVIDPRALEAPVTRCGGPAV